MTLAAPPILHIGYHKTGSSWLQRAVFPRVRNVSLVPRAEIRRNILVPSLVAFDAEEARRRLLEGRPGRVVLSDEELSGNLHTGGLHGAFSKEVAERLRACFPDGRVVIFVRNQRTMIASAYKQYIKSGGTRRIERFLAPSGSPHKTPGFALDFLVYDRLVSHYETLFGVENVGVYAYEEIAAQPRQLVAKLAGDLGLELDSEDVSVAPVNRGYRSRTLALLRVLNLFHAREMPNSGCIVHLPGWFALLRLIGPQLDRLPFMGREQELEDLLAPEAIRALEDRFRESNARLERARSLGLAGLGYPLP